jgi:hypothetical protein
MTPPAILDALGPFDLDPCAPLDAPWPTAARHFTVDIDGLAQQWDGRVWLNPPYTSATVGRWMERMAEHDHGTALIFARTETDIFFRHVWERAHAVLFLRGRLHFHAGEDMVLERTAGPPISLAKGQRAPFNGGAPSVLIAYGATDAEILAFSQIAGQFVPLRFARSVLVEALSASWRSILTQWISDRGPVELSEIYRAFARHHKTKTNPNWRAKLRQTLQRGGFQRIERGRWQLEMAV